MRFKMLPCKSLYVNFYAMGIQLDNFVDNELDYFFFLNSMNNWSRSVTINIVV